MGAYFKGPNTCLAKKIGNLKCHDVFKGHDAYDMAFMTMEQSSIPDDILKEASGAGVGEKVELFQELVKLKEQVDCAFMKEGVALQASPTKLTGIAAKRSMSFCGGTEAAPEKTKRKPGDVAKVATLLACSSSSTGR